MELMRPSDMRRQELGYCAPLRNERGSHLPDEYGERQSFT